MTERVFKNIGNNRPISPEKPKQKEEPYDKMSEIEFNILVANLLDKQLPKDEFTIKFREIVNDYNR